MRTEFFTDFQTEMKLAVFKIAYCGHFSSKDEVQYREVCKNFVRTVSIHSPEISKKIKVHFVLHLVDSMLKFGPTSAFNTERLDCSCPEY